MNITRIYYEKLLAAATHAKAETQRADAASHALITLGAKYADLEALHEESLKREREQNVKIDMRDQTIVHIANRLSLHGDPEPIAGTE